MPLFKVPRRMFSGITRAIPRVGIADVLRIMHKPDIITDHLEHLHDKHGAIYRLSMPILSGIFINSTEMASQICDLKKGKSFSDGLAMQGAMKDLQDLYFEKKVKQNDKTIYSGIINSDVRNSKYKIGSYKSLFLFVHFLCAFCIFYVLLYAFSMFCFMQ